MHVAYFEAVVALILGCVMGGEGVKLGGSVRRIIFGSRVRGTIVSHQERLTRNGNRSSLFPVIEFVAASGNTVTVTDAISAGKWAIGRECAVTYTG